MGQRHAKTGTIHSVVLVEDDQLLATSLSLFLQAHGFSVEVEGRGDRALNRIMTSSPDAVILDGVLPGKDGLEICRELRRNFTSPILMLTARDEEIQQVLGLGLGADAYLVKPVAPTVVLAHLRACLRRQGREWEDTREEALRFGRLFMSKNAREVKLGSITVKLSTAEFDLLWLLASRAGEVLTRDDIKRELRNIDHDAIDRSIDMRVSRLRRLLCDDSEDPRLIKTVRGKGYLFSTAGWD